ncbi:LytTR family DNA-binding domain-containing protein [Luteolibacter flavescens]|uniref:LytTR family DNA-binding domain-containing protein n=1 Tax=Luteolibacter flavescens TaxID=1859460 RepID=A0ABT3FM84_9BACT|nr:LytTR family DNA-binding domain-containing protein [Luteolibacter flavescens]MCW1884668.1 LytTR family DNA-binding domain-containing protein [Luteolibacter flavescens]
MKKIRCVIVDDEELARERVRSLLGCEPDVEIVGEAADGEAALAMCAELRPDLVFLDIQMPRLSGFDVLEELPVNPAPVVIFTTAYDTHAVRAFEVSAVDYLLKPFKASRFKEALGRARERISSGSDGGLSQLKSHLHIIDGGPRVLVKSPERIVFVRAAEIDHVEAAGNYLVLHCGPERHIVRETMSAMTDRLESHGFMRVSRSAIINLSRLREVQPMGAGSYCVILKSGARVDMTIPLRDLQERLGAG